MNIFISINGVLRNLVQKYDHHYIDHYFNSDVIEKTIDIDSGEEIKQEDDEFVYKINKRKSFDEYMSRYKFQSEDEFNYFSFIEYPMELYGHAGLSYKNVITHLNEFIYSNPDVNVTLVGLDEKLKSKPSTLFFLSKNGFMGNNIKFINSEDISKEWKNCDIWITDSNHILKKKKKNKKCLFFKTDYNKVKSLKEHTIIDSLENLIEKCRI